VIESFNTTQSKLTCHQFASTLPAEETHGVDQEQICHFIYQNFKVLVYSKDCSVKATEKKMQSLWEPMYRD
jgi:hypothetical protein